MNQKLKKTIFVLHLNAILTILSGVLWLIFPETDKISAFLILGISIGIGVFLEIVANELKNNKYWAWIAGIIICVAYILRLLSGLEIANLVGAILGIIGLIGLLNKEVMSDFLKRKNKYFARE